MVADFRLSFFWVASILMVSNAVLAADPPRNSTMTSPLPKETEASLSAGGVRHMIGVGGEVFVYYGLDNILSPRAYRGADFGGALFYEYRGDKNRHDVSVNAGVGHPTPRTDTYTAELDVDGNPEFEKAETFQVQGEIRYAYHRILYQGNALDIGVGGALDAYINYLDATGFTWLAAYSLNPSVIADWRPKPKHMIRARVFTPLLTFLSRPTWTVFDDAVMDRPAWTNLFVAEVTSVHQFARVAAQLMYEWTAFNHVAFAFVYELSYIHTTEPRQADSLCNNVQLAVIPNFTRRHR